MQVHDIQPSRRPSFRLERGYSLMEVICAIAIAAIVTSILFNGFDSGYSILQTTREDLRATQILMQKTEAFRLYSWDELTNAPRTFQEYYYPAGITSSNSGAVYYGTVSALGIPTNIPDSDTYKANIHSINITVAWTNYNGSRAVPHTRQMQTFNAVNGMQNYLIGQTNAIFY